MWPKAVKVSGLSLLIASLCQFMGAKIKEKELRTKYTHIHIKSGLLFFLLLHGGKLSFCQNQIRRLNEASEQTILFCSSLILFPTHFINTHLSIKYQKCI